MLLIGLGSASGVSSGSYITGILPTNFKRRNTKMTSLIDFSKLATDLTPLIATAVTTAAGIGAVVLAARLCWGFFKKFSRG